MTLMMSLGDVEKPGFETLDPSSAPSSYSIKSMLNNGTGGLPPSLPSKNSWLNTFSTVYESLTVIYSGTNSKRVFTNFLTES